MNVPSIISNFGTTDWRGGQVFHAAAVGAEHLAKQQQKSFGEGKGETSPL